MNDTALLNPLAIPGSNNPPIDPPTPFEIVLKKIDDLYSEARLWMDGEPIATQAQADDISNLKTMIRAAETEAEALRVAEKKPLDVRVAEIQARYAPLIADTKTAKGKTVLAINACNKTLDPWLIAESRRLEAEAAEARRIADEKRRAAEEAIRATDATNLAAREEAEALVKDAKKADAIANRAGRQTATAGGTLGRATGLRSYTVATLTDPVAAARWAWTAHRDEMTACIQALADKDATAGKRDIPGFEITVDQRVI